MEKIRHHVDTFPERYNDTLEMQKEWKEMKNKALWILVSFVVSILAIGIWVGTIEANIATINSEHTKAEERNRDLERRLGILEVNNGQILADLANIKLGIQELKVAIRELR